MIAEKKYIYHLQFSRQYLNSQTLVTVGDFYKLYGVTELNEYWMKKKP